MTMKPAWQDLIALVADSNIEAAIRALVRRKQSLGIRQIDVQLYVHPERDAGCRVRASEFLRPFSSTFRHALVVFDRAGCGCEDGATTLEAAVEARLAATGWDDRTRVVVIDPELEIWVWSDSPHVDRALRWQGRIPTLRAWLRDRGDWPEGTAKPADPKSAVEAALRHVGVPRSSAIYRELAETVSIDRCTDRAFARLRETLATWFPRADLCD